MERINDILTTISGIIWGPPLIAALLGVSAYFSFKLKFLQVSHMKLAIKYLLGESDKSGASVGDISHFGSLCTAMSATLGTGNIVGVALGVAAGGPGAMFWMWLAAFFGMAAKYAEGFLAIKYRKIGNDGTILGGPMYYLEMGVGSKTLARLFAISGTLVALFGIGTMTQANSIAAAASCFGAPNLLTAVLLGLLVAVIIIGGIHRIAYVSEKIVPLMSVFYIGAAIIVLIMNASLLPSALYSILVGAFSPDAIFGGGVGITAMTAARFGISRGIFSHESGLGSAAIASAAAKTDSPIEQGLVAMIGAFFSIVVCTMTGLALIVTSEKTGIFSPNCSIDGTLLTSRAFGYGIGILDLGQYIVNFGILFFAFTTIIGWNYYGEKCVQYLWGIKSVIPYNMLFLFFVVIGPFYKIDAIFTVADIVTGLMAVPNLIGLSGLGKVVVKETRAAFAGKAAGAAAGI
jgi:AGCS family alanine or glycine:cation symporter